MAGQALSVESKFEQFAKERLGGLSSAIDCDLSEEELTEAVGKVSGHSSCRQMFYAVRDSYTGLEPVIEDIGNNRCLAAIRLNEIENINAILMIAVDGHVATVKPLLRSLVELYGLTQEIVTYRAALEESAMQLAQSFEEQNWLRSFARSASSFTDVSSANSMASGILQPLGYLLRAQDIYLIVEPSETERSGLTSTKFGGSNFRIHTIANLIESMGMHAAAPPLVRNRLEVQTNDGGIQSIIAVTIPSNGKNLGFLVGINRAAEMHDGLPVYDPEFGSGDVGLLEEAAVLLATQAHNVHLLVKSNQLFLGTLHAMSSAIDARDPYTQGHSERVARLSLELAKILGLSEVAQQEIYLSG
ncbi:MAG: hypothetical protein KDB22_13370, partial [Planctomycetales bacterium]|nr:hypothetical protein [Planctomycetales bacterium]